MKKIHVQNLVVLVLAAAALLAGCKKKGGDGQQAQPLTPPATEKPKSGTMIPGGEIVLGFATEMNNFDPFTSMTADARSVNFNIFDGLVNVAPDGSFSPAIAESYSSEEGRAFVFTLRQNVKFHDGSPLTHDDVLYSVQKAIDSKMAGYDKIRDFRFVPDGMGGVTDIFVITLKSADAGFIAYLTTPIVKKDAKDLALHPVGTGPYMLADYVEQDHIRLVKNPSYWGKGGYLDTVTLKFVASQADMVLNFQAGSIDGFSANADTVTQLPEKDLNLYRRNSNSVQLLALNNAVAPFGDVRVRQALSYLVDADEIIEAVNYGYGVKVGSGLIPALSKYYDVSLAGAYKKDVAKARALLAEAGYADGFSFTITVPSVYTVHVRTAEVILNQLAQAGIKASIKQVDWPTWLQNVYTGRQYEATIISLDGPLAYPTSYLSRYQSGAHNNFVNFASPAYDEVYAKAIASTDDDERVAYFKEAQKILSDEAASVFIEDISNLTVYSKKFAGVRDYPLYATDFSAIYRVSE